MISRSEPRLLHIDSELNIIAPFNTNTSLQRRINILSEACSRVRSLEFRVARLHPRYTVSKPSGRSIMNAFSFICTSQALRVMLTTVSGRHRQSEIHFPTYGDRSQQGTGQLVGIRSFALTDLKHPSSHSFKISQALHFVATTTTH